MVQKVLIAYETNHQYELNINTCNNLEVMFIYHGFHALICELRAHGLW